SGGFAPPTGYSDGLGDHPSILIASDFNGDGFADLATINEDSGDVSVLNGRGDGTFASGVKYPAGSHPAGLVAGDFNNDGKIDLATGNQDEGDVSILINLGDGTFGPAAHYPAGGTGLQY